MGKDLGINFRLLVDKFPTYSEGALVQNQTKAELSEGSVSCGPESETIFQEFEPHHQNA